MGYIYSKLYDEEFKSHAWQIIKQEAFPINSACKDLFFTILTESTRGGGRLRYSPERPYRPEEIFALVPLPKDIGRKCWAILIDKELIKVDSDGTIVVCRSDERFGVDTANARKCRRYRETHGKTPSDGFGEATQEQHQADTEATPARHQCDTKPTPSRTSPPNNHLLKDIKISRHQDIKKPKDEGKEPTDLRVVGKKSEENVGGSVSDSDRKADAFFNEYPKKSCPERVHQWFRANDPSDAEFGAMMVALERCKANQRWYVNGGQFVPHPWNWLSRHPWTKQDEETFEKRQYEASLNKPPVADDAPKKRELPTVEAKQIKEGE